MGSYLLNMVMVAIMALPFMLLGGAIVDYFRTRRSNRDRD